MFTSGGDLTEIGFEQSFVGMVTAGGEIGRVSIGGSATAMISAADQIGMVVAHDDFTGIITAGGRLGEVCSLLLLPPVSVIMPAIDLLIGWVTFDKTTGKGTRHLCRHGCNVSSRSSKRCPQWHG